MKQIFTLTLLIIVATTSFAGQKIKAKTGNNKFNTSATWDLNRMPADGDTIVVPAGSILEVDANLDYRSNNYFIEVLGTLKFTGSAAKLRMGSATTVNIWAGGLLDGGGNNSQLLEIGGTDIWKGNMADVSGPAYATQSSGSFRPMVLPVKFASFNVTAQGTAVAISWSTAEEQNAKLFVIERSTDGNNWIAIGSVKASGNSTTLVNYNYTDKAPVAGKNNYRIKQVDNNNRFEYTAIRSISNNKTASVQIIAQSGKVVLQFAGNNNNVAVQLVGLNGQVISKQNFSNAGTQVVFNTNVKGAVVVAVSTANGVAAAQQVML